MENALFYTNIYDVEGPVKDYIDKWTKYADINETGSPVYIIDAPLGEKEYHYDYKKEFVVLVPKHKILFVNHGDDANAFSEFVEDFLFDVYSLADKYEYVRVLGRVREWREKLVVIRNFNEIESLGIDRILDDTRIEDNRIERQADFLISLVTGSINDIEKTGIECPEGILEKIKRKIILFDGNQTRFIYEEPNEKRVVIQGLAGTGKTELLLHKIKKLYTSNDNIRIAFTCYNRILADNLKKRLPQFFDFLRVEEQIKWNEKLWVMSSWGSASDSNSGVYSYICNYYDIPFRRYSYTSSFDLVCREANDLMSKKDDIEPCFDYILIDESQDFTESFFKLCERVTKKKVYIAGDIFQDVFGDVNISKVNPQFLLNECYRTDPKTLMAAHAIGMGLFEKDGWLRWLTDKEWEDCGYSIKRSNGFIELRRRPLRRFEDLKGLDYTSLKIIPAKKEDYFASIIAQLEEIRNNNPSVMPDDIGIIFSENTDVNYTLAKCISEYVGVKYGWQVNFGHESKVKMENTLFISNRNNVKGLEFPFVICFSQIGLTDDLRQRNSIYMMLTRSFIASYYILPISGENLTDVVKGVGDLEKEGYLRIREPNDAKKKQLRNAFISRKSIFKSQKELVADALDELGINDRELRDRIIKVVSILCPEVTDKDKIFEVVRANAQI